MDSRLRRIYLGGGVLVVQLAVIVSAQGCLLAAEGRAPPFRDDNESPRLSSGTQAIITSYKFGCCGNITAWQTYVQPGGKNHLGAYNITFQVWRPSLTMQGIECYSLVGENIFTSLSLGEGGLVSETPEPSNILTVQPGDVVGYYTLSGKDTGEGIQLDTNRSIDSVWYHTGTGSELDIGALICPFLVETATMVSFTNAAPILSVNISSFSCPLTPTISPAFSSLLPPSMIATSASVPTQLSDTISQPTPTPIPLPSATSEVVPTFSTVMSKQSTSPTSKVSQQMASPTSDMSQHTASPTSDMSQQMTSTTSVVPPRGNNDSDNNDGLGGVVAACVVTIVTVMSVLIVLIAVVLLRKRKMMIPQINEAKEKSFDTSLSNPNYDNCTVVSPSLLKHQSYKKRQSSHIKPSNEPPHIPVGSPDMEVTRRLSLDTGEPVDYMHSIASHKILSGSSTSDEPPPIRIGSPDKEATMYTSIDTGDTGDYVCPIVSIKTLPVLSTDYANVAHLPGKDGSVKSAEMTDQGRFYHMVGENIRQYATDEISNRSTPSPHQLSLSTRNSTGHIRPYHILEVAPDDPSVQYEEPKLPKFRQDLAKKKGAFELTGYCVPTEEERRTLGKNYKHQYENTRVVYDKPNFFVEDQIYWTPARTTSGLYSQLASKRYREIQRDQIRMMEKIGSGQFGEVCKAVWTVGRHKKELAVKNLKPGASEEDKVKFLQEAAIMGQFSHSNVIKMYGVVTLGEPVLICLEILANGDLSGYLQGLNLRGSKYRDFMEAQIMFLKFAKNIAAGMHYLSQKSFVHRDLAARNILLNKSLTCKVADFGMARDLVDCTYYKSSGGKIPVKWTAPEALLYKKYSADSDVWSYGMVLFEIWSMAKKPFSTVTNSEVLQLIQIGFCQAPPPGCPRAVYELMVDCWNPDHTLRPSFSVICSSYLQKSSAKILYWAPADENLFPGIGVSGGPLEDANELHLDLQEKYKNYNLKA